MTTTKRVKRHDLGDPLVATCAYVNRTIDITGEINETTPVVFIMTNVDSGVVVVNRQPASVIVVGSKYVVVRYGFQAGETDTIGTYRGEFEFDLTGGPATAPSGGYLTIEILEDLG